MGTMQSKPVQTDQGKTGRFAEEIRRLKADMAKQAQERQTLRELDCFVLDNSLRESTVGQLRGHTLENKMKIYEEVKKCGFEHVIVAAFSHNPRVDDIFVQQLVDQGEDMSTLYAFAEATGGVKDGVPDTTTIPIALQKMRKLKLRNPILEIDLADKAVDWDSKFTVQNMCELLLRRIEWCLEFLCRESKIFVNLRDFPFSMIDAPERVLTVVHYLASLPSGKRPFGILFEDPTGKYLPEEVGAWTASVRRVMDSGGWQSGNLLVHVHKKWGLAETVQLECLSNGATGIWASVCEEGAAVGHACSSIALMNLVRLGNRKVLKRYNCTYLRTAAINVTHITIGSAPHPKQVVYGERSLDMTFDFGGIAGGDIGEGEFDVAKFFGVEPPVRINTLASTDMIQKRLVDLFGEDPQFTSAIASKMKEVMIEDLATNRKEEYMSKAGLALLFDRSGGKITATMRDEIEKAEIRQPHMKQLIGEVRVIWDTWDLKDDVQGDDMLQLESFYSGFMSPYFGCFQSEDTKRALKAIDMDCDGYVDWSEFLVYLKWAVSEYPDIKTTDELLSITFRKGIIPAMQDEVLK